MRGPFGLLLVGGGVILIVGLFTGKITFSGASTTNTPGAVPNGVPSTNPVGTNVSGKTGTQSCPPGYKYDLGYKKCVPTVNAVNG